MGSLRKCLETLKEKHGVDLVAHEEAIIRGLVDDYRGDGYEAQQAAIEAVGDYLARLEKERAGIVTQIRAKVPTFEQEATGKDSLPVEATQETPEKNRGEGSENLPTPSGEPTHPFKVGDTVIAKTEAQGSNTKWPGTVIGLRTLDTGLQLHVDFGENAGGQRIKAWKDAWNMKLYEEPAETLLAKKGDVLVDEYGENDWFIHEDIHDAEDQHANVTVTRKWQTLGEHKLLVSRAKLKERIAEDAKFRDKFKKKPAEAETPAASDQEDTAAKLSRLKVELANMEIEFNSSRIGDDRLRSRIQNYKRVIAEMEAEARAGETPPSARPPATVVDGPREGEYVVRDGGTNLARFRISKDGNKAVGVEHYFEAPETRDHANKAISAFIAERIANGRGAPTPQQRIQAENLLLAQLKANQTLINAALNADEQNYLIEWDAQRTKELNRLLVENKIPGELFNELIAQSEKSARVGALAVRNQIRFANKPPEQTATTANEQIKSAYDNLMAGQSVTHNGRDYSLKKVKRSASKGGETWIFKAGIGENYPGDGAVWTQADAAIRVLDDMGFDIDQIDRVIGNPTGKATPTATPPVQESAETKKAKQDLEDALKDLGQFALDSGFLTKKVVPPEMNSGQLLPILTRVLDAAFRLGYHKFKDAARFALETIRERVNPAFADAITLDHLQGAYIAMAGGKEGADTKKDVIAVESLDELADTPKATIEIPNAIRKAAKEAGRAATEGVFDWAGKASTRANIKVAILESLWTQLDNAKDAQDYVSDVADQVLEELIQEANTNDTARNGTPGQTTLESPVSEGVSNPRGQRGSGTRGDGRGEADGKGNGSQSASWDDGAGSLDGSQGTLDTQRPDEGLQPGLDDVDQDLIDSSALDQPEGEPHVPVLSGDNPGNYVITEASRIGEGSRNQRIENNLAAIRLVKKLDAEGRYATREEQDVLARYVGWGGLKNVFKKDSADAADRKANAELRSLLDQRELFWTTQGVLAQHFTAPGVVRGIYGFLEHIGFNGGHVIEPTVGAGNFIGLMPPGMREGTKWYASEIDPVLARIAQHLYPEAQIEAKGFQKVEFPYGKFDLAIGNPPFGDERITDTNPKRRAISGSKIHNYILAKSSMHLRPGGIMAMVVTHRFLDTRDTEGRLVLSSGFKLLGAIRLPSNAFAKTAGTSVTTDLVFLQRLRPGESREEDPAWLDTEGEITNAYGEKIRLNRYFVDNPHMMLGEPRLSGGALPGGGKVKGLYRAEGEFVLLGREGEDLEQSIADLISERMADLAGIVEKERDRDLAVAAGTYEQNREDVAIGGYIREGDKIMMRQDDDIDGNVQFVELTASMPWSSTLIPDDKGGFTRTVKEDKKTVTKYYANDDEVPDNLRLGETRLARIKGMLHLREMAYKLLAMERADDPRMEHQRKMLNRAYDAFVEANGFINDPANMRLMASDTKIEFGLEHNYRKEISAAKAKTLKVKPEKAKADKAPILEKRVFFPEKVIEHVENPRDAYAVSLSERGRLDLDYIAKLTGQDRESVIRELSDPENPLIFMDFDTNEWVQEDEYLSGNVKLKLIAAEERGVTHAVEALRKILPKDIPHAEIFVDMGATWVTPEAYAQFLDSLGVAGAKISINTGTGTVAVTSFTAESPNAVGASFSNNYYNLSEMFTELANKRGLPAYDPSPDGRVLNKDKTKELEALGKRMVKLFREWIFTDPDRAMSLEKIYNDTQNTTIERHFDGKKLNMRGNNPDIELRDTQLDAAWRMVQSPAVLLDHVVGAGKTFTFITGIMERKRLGVSRKPMVVVPNHLVGQWARDWMALYPGANILAATEKDFAKPNRRRLFSRIATGNFDAIIVGHSSFGFIPVDAQIEEQFVMREIESLEKAMAAAQEADDKRTVRTLRNRIAKKLERIQRLRDATRDNVATFDDMGIDYLAVDESHEFKNLEYSSAMRSMSGMGNPSGSKKAFDLYVKLSTMLDRDGGVAFGTGTPISNSLVEMYSIMRYLNRKGLKERQLEAFDAWAKNYASIETRIEYTATNSLKARTVMATFNNVPEMLQLYNQFADTITMATLKKKYSEQIERRNKERGESARTEFPVPKVIDGGRSLETADPSESQREYVNYLIARVKSIEEQGRDLDPREDNLLWVYNDAKKAALDIRIVDPKAEDHPENKVNRAARNIKQIYDQWTADRGVQLVFCDLSTPTKTANKDAKLTIKLALEKLGLSKDVPTARLLEELSWEHKWLYLKGKMEDLLEQDDLTDPMRESFTKFIDNEGDFIGALITADVGFSVYDDLKSKLVASGIPESEIRFIHEANTRDQKQELFDMVNSGIVRILMGSTAKMGAGTNVQERAVWLHHLDSSQHNRPADIEQREGRIIRQGNKLYERDPEGFAVGITAYSTNETFDAVSWQTLARKASMLEDFRSGVRQVEDLSSDSASYNEFMAETTGNQIFKEKIKLEGELDELESMARRYTAQLTSAQSIVKRKEEIIADWDREAKAADRVLKAMGDEKWRLGDTTLENMDLDDALEEQARIYRAAMSEWRAAMEKYAAERKAWEEAEKGERGRAPSKPVPPKDVEYFSPEILEKSEQARFMEAINDELMRMEPEESLKLRFGDQPVNIIVEDRSTDTAQRYVFIAKSPFFNLVSSAHTPGEPVPDYLRGLLRSYKRNATSNIEIIKDREQAIRQRIANAEELVASGGFPEQAKLEAKRERYDEVAEEVSAIEEELDRKRAELPNRYLNADRRRFPNGYQFQRLAPRVYQKGDLVRGPADNRVWRVLGSRRDQNKDVLYRVRDITTGEKDLVPADLIKGYSPDVRIGDSVISGRRPETWPPAFSRPGRAQKRKGMTADALRDQLVVQLGKGIKGLEASKTLNIVQSVDELPEGIRKFVRGDEEGAYWHGRAYIIADNVSQARATAVVLHELGEHFGLERMLGAKAYTNLQGRINTMYRMGNPRVKAAWEAVLREYRDDKGRLLFKEGSKQHLAEVIARLGEQNVFTETQWWKALIAKLKAFLMRIGLGRGLVSGTITDADLNALLIASVRASVRDEAKPSLYRGSRIDTPINRDAYSADDFSAFARQFGVSPEQLRKEFDAAKARHEGTEGWMKAPNGQPTRLNRQQWVMVRTPRFKAWFGDWENDPAKASKVVDDNGEPLVVYHGTMEDFTEFNVKAKAAFGKLDTKLGSHFARSPKISDTFAGGAYAVASDYYVDAYTPENSWYRDHSGQIRFDGLFGYRGGWNDPIVPYDPAEHGEFRSLTHEGRIVMLRPNGTVLPVFLNIKKPIDAMSQDKDAWDETEVEKGVARAILPTHPEIFRDYILPIVLDGEAVLAQLQAGQTPITQGKYSYPDIGAFVADYHAMNYVPADVVKAALRDEGFDGVIYNNTSKQEINNTDQSQRQSYIIFEPEQAKSATGNTGAFDHGDGDLLRQRPAQVFYSELAQQLGAVKATKAPADQWKAIINGLKQKGVKQDEIEWSGVLDWLDLAQGPVTREQIQAYLQGNGVQVQEVEKGEINEKTLSDEELEEYDQLVELDRVGDLPSSQAGRLRELRERARQVAAGSSAKYDQWQLPGGDNYRELLITLPQRDPDGIKARLAEIADEMAGNISTERYGELHAERARLADRYRQQFEKGVYRSAHWDEPNILTHIRFNERTITEPLTAADQAALRAREALQADYDALTAELGKAIRQTKAERRPQEEQIKKDVLNEVKAGTLSMGDMDSEILNRYGALPETPGMRLQREIYEKREAVRKKMPPEPKQKQTRVLFIEEIQSDWGQEGKRKGFKRPPRAVGLPETYLVTSDQYQWHVTDPASGRTVSPGKGTVGDEMEARAYAKRYFDSLAKDEGGSEYAKPPTAPFVTDTKAWVSLALKRMIRYAADIGADRIAWATGEQQARRYPDDMRRVADHIEWDTSSDGKGVMISKDHAVIMRFGVDERGVIGKSTIGKATGQPLEDLIGKEMASQIMGSDFGDIDGGDFVVGGKGMIGFYDQILPQVANSLLKKFGGGKVGQVEMDSRDETDWREKRSALIRQRRSYDHGTPEWERLSNEIHELGQKILKKPDAVISQPGFDITPALKDRALQGLPLFQRPEDRLQRARAQGYDPNKVWYHGTPIGNDIRAFDLNKVGNRTGTQEGAIFLTDNPDVAAAYGYTDETIMEGLEVRYEESGGSILPLHIRGLLYDASREVPDGRYRKAAFEAILDKARKGGYDGVDFGEIVDVPAGTPYGQPMGRVVAMFSANHIRSINAEFDPARAGLDDLLFSRNYGDVTPEQEQFLSKIGVRGQRDSKLGELRADIKLMGLKGALSKLSGYVRQKAIDQYESLRQIDEKLYGKNFLDQGRAAQSGWALAKMARASEGALEALWFDGRPYMDGRAVNVDTAGKGLSSVFAKLKGEEHRFLAWVAANRSREILRKSEAAQAEVAKLKDNLAKLKAVKAEALKFAMTKEVKQAERAMVATVRMMRAWQKRADVTERLFTPDEINAGLSLNQGSMEDGRDRAGAYGAIFREFKDYQTAVLDIAEQTGLIEPAGEDEVGNPTGRAVWESEFYVPFYRVLDEVAPEGTKVRGPKNIDGLVRQQAFKHLKGGKEKLNDLMLNTIGNFHHLLTASLKNQAAAQALQNAEAVGAAEPANPNETGDDIVWVNIEGKKVNYRVTDPMVLESISALGWQGFRDPVMRSMETFKRWYTMSVTANPAFIARNLLRDSIHSIAVSGLTKNAGKNILQGWKASNIGGITHAKMRAGGGAFHFGYVMGDERKSAEKLMEAGVPGDQILNTLPKLQAAWRKYEEFGSRVENVNRAALYAQARAKGKSHLEASLEARDLLDFTQRGASAAVRFLSYAVPFLNARFQGLDKLARALRDDKQRGQFLAVGGAVALASVALYLAYMDDPDFKEREEWDRDTYWWFKIGDQAFRIPKPFEVGLLFGTVPERLAEQWFDPEATGELFRKRMLAGLTTTLEFNPVPAVFMPTLEIWANKDTFTDRPIETMGMERLSPSQRKAPRTTLTAEGISDASNLFGLEISPVQADHLIKGYLGWIGATVAHGVDWLAEHAGAKPEASTPSLYGAPVVGDFVRSFAPDEKAAASKYVTRFYEQSKEIEQAFNDFRHAQRYLGEKAAADILADQGDKIRLHKLASHAQAELSKINQQLRQVEWSDLPKEQKRTRIELLTARKNFLARRASQAIQSAEQ